MKLHTTAIIALCCACLSASAQDNVTSQYIKNPSLESGFSGWTAESLSLQSNSSFTIKEGATYAEKWVSSGSTVGNASLAQTLTSLPAGEYRLTVAAQNCSQSQPTKECAGAVIYAGAAETTVYTAADYSVEFTCLTGEVEIGFRAKNAKGNWLAVDNFRLYLLSSASAQQIVDSIAVQVSIADSLLLQEMDERVHTELAEATAAARVLTASDAIPTLQDALKQLLYSLDRARFAILLANAPTSSSLKVSTTNHYVPTGATQALMRAKMSGSSQIESGICWSTEPNPTVLDNRSTGYYSLNGNIYHVKGMEPSTVYYLRPYVMNKNYAVAYGDEVKIVTHPQGNCVGTWDGGAPDDAANARCKSAIEQTIAYFNEWTGIRGFVLSGHYGSGTPTADCSYGGWMRIGPNASYQAIGTVLHETGHGVGVGTSARWSDTNFHNWQWKGSEGNRMYQFLENKEGDASYYMVGDAQHSWGNNATYDWFVNGADKDTHSELQYVGGCCLLYAYFIDGLCPTYSYTNGISGYTYNFDADSTYYIMSKNADMGLGSGLLYMKEVSNYKRLGITECLAEGDTVPAEAGWRLEYDPVNCGYLIRSAVDGKYITHSSSSSVAVKSINNPGETERFQLMPARIYSEIVDDEGKAMKKEGYWFCWNADGKDRVIATPSKMTGNCAPADYDASDSATKQQWLILTREEVARLNPVIVAVEEVEVAPAIANDYIYNILGQRVERPSQGLFIVNGKKTLIR